MSADGPKSITEALSLYREAKKEFEAAVGAVGCDEAGILPALRYAKEELARRSRELADLVSENEEKIAQAGEAMGLEAEERPTPKTPVERRNFLRDWMLGSVAFPVMDTAKAIEATPADTSIALIEFAAWMAKSASFTPKGWREFTQGAFAVARSVPELRWKIEPKEPEPRQ